MADDENSIGLWSAASIGIGGMIGAGIFSILGVAADTAGNAFYISFLVSGLIALLSTYSFAKLGARYPSAGGPVEFLVKGFGDSTISGGLNILLWIGYLFALALYAEAFAGYATSLLPVATSTIWLNIVGTIIILVFCSVNFIGAKAVGKSEVAIVAVKVIILLGFIAGGLFFANPKAFSFSNLPHLSNFVYGAGIVFLAYEGFGLITNAAEDMKNPEETLPKALYLSVGIVIIVYVLVSLAVIGNLPIGEIVNAKEYALAEAARPFLGSAGFTLIGVAALFSTSSAINATLYGGANVSYEIAKEGELPSLFERKVWGRSSEGLFITAGIVIVFVNILELDGIALLGSSSFLLIYAAVNIAHLKLYKETGAKRSIVIASAISCLIFLGILIYYILRTSPFVLMLLTIVIIGSFFTEWLYRKRSLRIMKERV